MKVSAECMHCLVRRQAEGIKKEKDEEKKAAYLAKVLEIIGTGAEEKPAPVLLSEIGRLHEDCFGTPFSFEELKKGYNQMMMDREDEILKHIQGAEEPLKLALKYSQIGNYIDFGALDSVDDAKLSEFLSRAESLPLDEKTYADLKRELERAETMVLLTDNCGEVVLDKLLLKTIAALYPHVRRVAVVRGEPVLNDATMRDAIQTGLIEWAETYGNGTNVAGTYLPMVQREAKQEILGADFILAKGQGNFESLHGCGLNIYYLFLCKCDWFMECFGMERFSGVFVREKDLKD